MKINIKESLIFFSGFYVTVETKSGKRYETYYTVKPTIEEVEEDFKQNKNSFSHIN